MNIRHLSFRLLQVYVQVARLGGISAAARQLHLTQPTVSLQLKRLAEAVGEPLFEQNEGRMALTHVGQELYGAACDVLGRFDDFGDYLQQARDGHSGQLRIGVVTTAQYVMPRILSPFCQRHPKVGVSLSVGNRAQVLERFARSEDDLYLFSHPPSGPTVTAARMLKNPLQLIAPLGHWAAGREALSFHDLRGERFLMREPGSATRLMFESWLSGQGVELGATMQIESNEAIRLSVASGLGLSVISAHTLLEGHDKLAVLPVAGFPLESHWYLVTRKDRRLPHAAAELIRFIGSHLQDYIEPEWIYADIGKLAGHFAPAA